MADLTASDVTLSLHRGLDIARLDSGMLLVTAEAAFGDGALTYPANGVPLPAIGNFGLATIKRVFIEGQPGDGFVYKYDRTNHTMRIWQGGGFTPSGAVAAPTFSGTPADMEAQILRWSIQNLKGADADVADSFTTDQAAGPTNDDLIDTFAVIAAGAWAYTENLEIDIPRNVCLTLLNGTGGALNMEEGAFTAEITGTFRGQAQTDTITETFTAGNKAIAAAQYRWKYGVKPFDHITDVVVTGITANQNDIQIGIGIGRLLGVPVEPKDNVVGDFVKITKNSASMEPVAYNDTHKTLDLGALADDDDFDIEVEVASIGEAYTPAGTNSVPAFTGVAVAAGALVELGNVAVSAKTLYLMILGL